MRHVKRTTCALGLAIYHDQNVIFGYNNFRKSMVIFRLYFIYFFSNISFASVHNDGVEGVGSFSVIKGFFLTDRCRIATSPSLNVVSVPRNLVVVACTNSQQKLASVERCCRRSILSYSMLRYYHSAKCEYLRF